MSKKTLILIYTSLSVFLLIIFFTPHFYPDFCDFKVYYKAGKDIIAGKTVFDTTVFFQYRYAPVTALLWRYSISLLPFKTASVTWYIFSMFMWLSLFVFIYNWFSETLVAKKNKNTAILYSITTIIFFAVALRDELRFGNLNIFPVGLLCIFYYCYKEKKNIFLLSLILALAISFKLYALIAFGYLFFRKDYLLIFMTLLMIVVLNLGLTSIFTGYEYAINENINWYKILTTSTLDLSTDRNNISLVSTLARYGIKGILNTVIWALFCMAYVFAQYKYKKLSEEFNLSMALLAVSFITPVAWINWVIFALPSITFILFSLINNTGLLSKKNIILLSVIALFYISIDTDTAFIAGAQTWAYLLNFYLLLTGIPKKSLKQ